MTARPTIIDVMEDPALFQPWFRDPKSWRPWKAFLRVLFGLKLTAWDLNLFKACTGLDAAPEGRIEECWCIVGRRGGKSSILALIGVYLAVFVDWSAHLVAGERALIAIVSGDRRQSKAIYGYARAMLERVPVLSGIMSSSTDEEIALANGINLEIATADWRRVRGATVLAGLLDELSTWPTGEAANPDTEVIRALRPATASIAHVGHPLLICAGSPFAQKGEMWDAYCRYFGKPGRVLVWMTDTLTMRPSLPRRIIDEAFERDPVAAASEFGRGGTIVFRSDVSGFLDAALIDVAIDGATVRPPCSSVRYCAFCDASSGRSDSFVVAVAHAEGKRVVLDAISEWRAPFNAAQVVGEAAAFLRGYGCTEVTGDRYSVGFVVSLFAEHGVRYYENIRVRGPGGIEQALDRSGIYLSFAPLLTSGRATLLSHPRMRAQLLALQRRSYASGRDVVGHPATPGARDDVANAVAGVCVLASTGARSSWLRNVNWSRVNAAMGLAPTPGARGRQRSAGYALDDALA